MLIFHKLLKNIIRNSVKDMNKQECMENYIEEMKKVKKKRIFEINKILTVKIDFKFKKALDSAPKDNEESKKLYAIING